MLLRASHSSSTATFGCFKPCTFQSHKLILGHPPRRPISVQAVSDEDAQLEERLDKVRRRKSSSKEKEAQITVKKGGFDYSGEVVFFEGGPARGDLWFNLALAPTLLWLPLTIAAIGRALFVKYRFTDKRIAITTSTPFQVENIDVAYQNVKDVISIGRAFGAWGDLLITLRDNTKIELRSADRYLELKKYALERRDALAPPSPLDEPGSKQEVVKVEGKRGFS